MFTWLPSQAKPLKTAICVLVHTGHGLKAVLRDMGKAESKYVLIRDGPEGECQSGQVQVHVQVTPEPDRNEQQQTQETENTSEDSDSAVMKMPLTVALPGEDEKQLDSQVVEHTNTAVQTAETESETDNQPTGLNQQQMQEVKCGVSVSGLEKQEWCFTLYDFEGRGRVTREDLARLMKSLYHAVGASLSSESSGTTRTLNLRLTVNPDIGSIRSLHATPPKPHRDHHRHRKKKHTPKQISQNNFDEQKTKAKSLLPEHKMSNLVFNGGLSTERQQLRLVDTPDKAESPQRKAKHATHSKYHHARRPKSGYPRHTKELILQQKDNLIPVDLPPPGDWGVVDVKQEGKTTDPTPNDARAWTPEGAVGESSPVRGCENSRSKKHRHRTNPQQQKVMSPSHHPLAEIHQGEVQHVNGSPNHRDTGAACVAGTAGAHAHFSTEQEEISVVKPRTRTRAVRSRKSRPVSMPVEAAGAVVGAAREGGVVQRHEHHHIHEHHHHHHHYHWYNT